ncbi:MAG: class I SAM-dependent methyltransferase [Acidobacteriota bacterium]
MSPATYRDEAFDQYLSSIYAHLRNDLSEAGLERSIGTYDREFGAYLPDDRQAAILEIGCGSGGFLRLCKSLGYERVQGIDISQEQVDFCNRNGLPEVECSDGLSFLEGSPGRFDLILMSDVLEHCPKAEALGLLRAIHGALDVGGRVVVRVPNMSNPLNLRTRFVDITHELGFTRSSLAQVFELTGFTVDRVEGAVSRHSNPLARLVFDRFLWAAFRLLYRQVLWLDDEALQGKNLIGVGRKASA